MKTRNMHSSGPSLSSLVIKFLTKNKKATSTSDIKDWIINKTEYDGEKTDNNVQQRLGDLVRKKEIKRLRTGYYYI